MRTLLFLLALLIAPAATAQEAAGPADVAGNAITNFIRPSFDALARSAATLEGEVAALCAGPSNAALERARGGFADALRAYARIDFLRFGPLVRDNRAERLLFWPDPRGVALRQVQAALAEQPQDALDPARLAGKSVALQGFTALEFVLYGTGAEALADPVADPYRCRFGSAVASSIAAIATALAAEWNDAEDISRRLISPMPGDADYRTVREVLEEFVGQLSFGIEAIRDTALLPFLGRTRFDPKPRSAPFWRSGLTIPLVAAKFDGIEDFFEAARFRVVVGEENRWLETSVDYDFGLVRSALARVRDPIEQALDDPAQVRALDEVLELTRDLQSLFGYSLASLLGLSVGFSSLDGD